MSQETVNPDSKKALLDAFDQVLKTQAEERAERLVGTRRARGRLAAVTWIAVVALLLTVAYLWIERPGWLFQPPPPLESAAVKEASLRIALANAARHVEHYRRQHGRLPKSLDETGTLANGISYEPGRANDYLLRGVNGPVRLALRSTDSLAPFVGNSFEVITRRPR
jgi:hypothetical protein